MTAMVATTTVARSESVDVPTFHRNPQRSGWDAHEPDLTPENVSSSRFGMIWESPPLDTVNGLPPRLYASPLYVDQVALSSGAYQGGTFQTVFAATSNGFAYAINAFPMGAVAPGTILWRTKLADPGDQMDGLNKGVQSTPVIDLKKKVLYVTTCSGIGHWQVFALDFTNGKVLPRWPVAIESATLTAPGIDRNAGPLEKTSTIPKKKGDRPLILGVQRGALNLSPDGERLYVTFGESPTGWIVAVDTAEAKVATAFATIASQRRFNGGIWGAGGPAVDDQGAVFVVVGTTFGGLTNQAHDWAQSILKLSDSKPEGFMLRGTYTPFNYGATATADVDLGSGGVCLIPDLGTAHTSTPELLAVGGKQGNIYLVNRAKLPGRLDQRPPLSTDPESDTSLLPPETQPQFGKRGPLNVFGPYTETKAAIDQARGRSVPAYFQGEDGANYLFVTGSTKNPTDFNSNVPPGLVRLKIETLPGQPAYLLIDKAQNDVAFENPGSPIVTSSGSHHAIVWVLDENGLRSSSLNGAVAPRPTLYAIDAVTMKLLWKSQPNELFTSGKYNEPAIARGTVFVGTDRIQAFGLRKPGEKPLALPTPKPAESVKAPLITDGKTLFNAGGACVTCHRPDGQGVPGAFPPLAGSPWVNDSSERLIRIVLHGVQGPIRVADKDYNVAMPGFGKVSGSAFNWSDEEIARVLTYIRQEWGNHASPVYPQQVARIHQEIGDHPAWTTEQLAEATK